MAATEGVVDSIHDEFAAHAPQGNAGHDGQGHGHGRDKKAHGGGHDHGGVHSHGHGHNSSPASSSKLAALVGQATETPAPEPEPGPNDYAVGKGALLTSLDVTVGQLKPAFSPVKRPDIAHGRLLPMHQSNQVEGRLFWQDIFEYEVTLPALKPLEPRKIPSTSGLV